MKIRIPKILLAGLCVLSAACAKEDMTPRMGVLSLSSSIVPFQGDDQTKTNIEGTDFAVDDWMKLKIICPFSDRTEFGETTYGDTMDAFWILKWSGSGWSNITSSDKVDVGGSYKYTSSRNPFTRLYEAQQTPYVYTASTWSQNVRFMSNGSYYSQYSYIFHADQTEAQDYFHSDLLWAQTYMQTGSYDVHLAFNHVMACIKITITGGALSSDAVVTLEGMPDIDQREVVVGDYYAAKSKINSGFGYQQKTQCSKGNNGKVLGVAVIDDTAREAKVYPMSGNPANTNPVIPNTGVYKAHYDSGVYYLIVPPCTLASNAVFWIRDGEKRYSYQLQTLTFEQGKLYPVNITLN